MRNNLRRVFLLLLLLPGFRPGFAATPYPLAQWMHIYAPLPANSTVLSVTPTGPVLTNQSTVTYQVTFDRLVTGVSANSFQVAGTSGATIAGFSGSGGVYFVYLDVSGVLNDVVSLNVLPGSGITPDLAASYTAGTPVTIDRQAPTAAISGCPPASGPVSPTVYGQMFTSDDPNATFQLSLDGQAYQSWSGNHAAGTPGPEGRHSISIKAIDAAGNESLPATCTWTVLPGTPTAATNAMISPGNYLYNGTLTVWVTFNRNVTVTGTPAIPVLINGVARQANYAGGAGSATLAFNYTVQTADGNYTTDVLPGSTLVFDAGAIQDEFGLDVAPAVQSVVANNVFLDGQPPVVDISAPTDIGLDFSFAIRFHEPVTGFDVSDIQLSGISAAAITNLVDAGNGEDFVATVHVQPSMEGQLHIYIPDGAASDQLGNPSIATASDVRIDVTPPAIVSIIPPTSGTYTVGQPLDFKLDFSENVIVAAGSPSQVTVMIGGVPVAATYRSGSGTSELTFRYTVANGDFDMDGLDISHLITGPPGQLADAAGNVVLADNQSELLAGVLVDGRPVDVTLSPNQPALTAGTPFTLDVVFTGPVSGLDVLDFAVANCYVTNLQQTTDAAHYTIEVSPATSGLVSISLPAGVITVASGLASNTVSNTINTTADFTAPTITGVDLPANGLYTTASGANTLDFHVHFSEDMVFPSDHLSYMAINMTTGVGPAFFVSSPNPREAIYRYTVQNGDQDLDGISISPAIGVAGGAVLTDVVGNNLTPFISAPMDGSNILVDAKRPDVTLSTASGTGSSNVNGPTTVNVHFSEPVSNFTGGNLTLIDATAGPVTTINAGTDYSVVITPTTVNAFATISIADNVLLSVNGNGNTVSNTLRLFLQPLEPTVQISGPATAAGDFQITMQFSEPVTPVDASMLQLSGPGSTGGITGLTTTDNINYTATVIVPPNVSGTLNIVMPAGAVSSLAYGMTNRGDVLMVRVDNVGPSVSFVRAPNGPVTWRLGNTFSFTVAFDDKVVVTGAPTMPVTIGSKTVQAEMYDNDGNGGLSFHYTVVADDYDDDGIEAGASLQLNGAIITDANGNIANPLLNGITPTNNVFVNARYPTVTLAPLPDTVTGTFNVIATCSEPSARLSAGSVIALNANVGTPVSSDGGITYVIPVTPINNLPVSVYVLANAILNGGNGVDGNPNQQPSNAVNTIAYVKPFGPAGVFFLPGAFGLNAIMQYAVVFNSDVTITGKPTADLVIGGKIVEGECMGYLGSGYVLFQYIIQEGDLDLDGPDMVPTLDLHGGAIRDGQGHNSLLTIPPPLTGAGMVINGVRPTVTLTTAAASTNQTPFPINVDFSEPVTGLTLAAFTSNATVSDLQTTDNQHYTVNITPAFIGDLVVTVGDAVATNSFNNPSKVSNSLHVYFDNVAPTATVLYPPVSRVYTEGEQLVFSVDFDEPVQVTGNPIQQLKIGNDVVDATYLGSSNNAITQTFGYTIQAGQNDADGVETIGMLTGGTITDAAGNAANRVYGTVVPSTGVKVNTTHPTVTLSGLPAGTVTAPFTITAAFSEAVNWLDLTHFTVTNATLSDVQSSDYKTYNILVTPMADGNISISLPDGAALSVAASNTSQASNTLTATADITAPVITGVTVPVDITYHAGQSLTFTVTYSENVTVTGTPALDIAIGSKTATAAYVSGDGTNQLTFTYTVVDGDLDRDGIEPATSLTGVIKDIAGNTAANTLQNVPGTSLVYVNAVQPTVTLSTDATGTINAPFTVTATFSEVVSGLDITGFTTVNAALSDLQTTDHITYTMQVRPLADGAVSVQLPANAALNSGSNGNIISNILTLNADVTAPVITAVAVPVDITYHAGQSLTFTVTYSENVTVTGTPALDIAIGSKTATAAYVSGSGANQLTFTYTVVDGDLDRDGIVPASDLTGVIKDAAGNTAVNTLQNVPGTSLVYVNAVQPTVVLSTDATGAINAPFTVTATFSEVVSGLDITVFTTVNAALSDLQTTDHITYTMQVKPLADGAVSVTLPASAALNSGSNGNLVSNTLTLNADITAPAITAVAVPADDTYHAGQPLTFTVTYSENVTITGTPALDITIGGKTATAAYASGTGTNKLTFTYTVVDGDLDRDGIVPASDLTGVIKDAGGNTAANTLQNVPGTSQVFVNAVQPTVVLSTDVTGAISAAFRVTATFSEAVSGLDITAFTVSNATLSELQTTDNITYTMLATPVADGALSISLPANKAQNTGSNGNTVSNMLTLTVAFPPPVPPNQAPVFDIITDQQLCAGSTAQTLQITGASAVEAEQTLTFSISSDQDIFSTLSISNSGLITYAPKPNASGAAHLTVRLKDDGGTDNGGTDSLRRTFMVTLHAAPAVSISSDKGNTITKGATIQLTASGADTYAWSSGENTATLQATPAANTTYKVTGTTAAGCSDTASYSIQVVEAEFKVDAVNLLTPNGDGHNDKWIINHLENYPNNEVTIFDRTGRIVYHQKNYSNTWDGTFNGSPLAEGTYYYVLTVEGHAPVKGFITLLRDQQ